MLRLRDLSLLARLGLSAVVAVFLLGLWASTEHLRLHHQKRDEVPGLSMTDIVGAYHGISAPSRLREAIAGGHPETLAATHRTALLKWLGSDPAALSRDYDNLDLGDLAPSELIAAHCLSCHGQAEAPGKGGGLALANWEDVKRIAFPVQIEPAPYSILVASTHAHALTLAAIAALLALLLAFSRWPRWLLGAVVFALGVGLLLDIGGWWATRHHAAFVWTIVVGGALFNLGALLALLLTLAELWLPRGAR